MKNLIIQTYYTDDIKRNTVNTYKKFPKLERLSKKCFELYAKNIKADYEFCEKPEKNIQASAHWLRMVMFNRPEYDNVLYVDCDILINRSRLNDNIFEYKGVGVNKIHFYNYTDYPIFNAGVTKWTQYECEIMKENIDKYYHPTHNQEAINNCYLNHIGPITFLPYRFNVTHRPTNDITFRHYAGSHKEKQNLKKDLIWKQWS